LAQAAEVMTSHPAALQLRLLQTVVEVAAEKNSTLVLPFPVELLRFLEKSTPTDRPAPSRQTATPETGSADGAGNERGTVLDGLGATLGAVCAGRSGPIGADADGSAGDRTVP
jgi:hypothetical protein